MPPPPPAPPPASVASGLAPSALLKSIEKGTKLKKTVTNDRSGPLIEGTSKSTGSLNQSIPTGISSGAGLPPPQLGGLFAEGMPKLKSTSGSSLSKIPSNENNNQKVQTQSNDSLSNFPSNPKIKPVVPSRSPPLPARMSTTQNNAPPITQGSLGIVPKPLVNRPAPPVPTSAPRQIPPNPTQIRSPISSPRESTHEMGSTTVIDGRWTFKTDIPIPRQFPSGDSPLQSNISGSASLTNSLGKSRPPPPPPPSRSGIRKPPVPAPR